MNVVTRFAPSPTGFLHIGGARTALFNWLFSRHHGGKYLLRIEDTDRKRSTQEAIDAILDGLQWLGLEADEEPLFQSTRLDRHAALANQLLAEGKAYHCYCTPQELTEMRETAKAEGRSMRYDGRWRDRDPSEAPAGIPPVVRFQAPQTGDTVLRDAVQGDVTVANDQLDDMVLLRADGTPTYMLSVVVDDHDMAITHVIRGDDHLTNAFRQIQLFLALGWQPPVYGHIPLIHGADGAKMSKRHGALGVDAYRDMGYLPEALLNYLLRLGWSHGDDEIISREQAVEWFDIAAVNRGAARFDFDKLSSLNSHYLKASDNQHLVDLIVPGIEKSLAAAIDTTARPRLIQGMNSLKDRAKTINELIDISLFYVRKRPLALDEKAARLLTDDGRRLLALLSGILAALEPWSADAIDAAIHNFADKEGAKLGQIAQPLRAALCGTTTSPGIFEVAEVLGKEEVLGRLADVISA
ncbi:MAG: glutamate--tRNA ligase [Proteobacteria bacterium]|nr:glutamate--tRNA ligase [Pseudomonadota bacterium]